MIQFFVIGLLQAAAGDPAVPQTVGSGVGQEAPAASSTAPETAPAPAPEVEAEAEPEMRTERRCTRERASGSTRTARVLVCRDVQVPVSEGSAEEPAS